MTNFSKPDWVPSENAITSGRVTFEMIQTCHKCGTDVPLVCFDNKDGMDIYGGDCPSCKRFISLSVESDDEDEDAEDWNEPESGIYTKATLVPMSKILKDLI